MKNIIWIGLTAGVLFGAGFLAFAGTRWGHQPEPKILNGAEELRKVYLHYQSDAPVSFSGTIDLLDGENGNKLKERTPFRCIRYGRKACYGIGPLQTFITDSLYVQLDTASRQIAVSRVEQKWGQKADLLPFERLLTDTTFKTEVRAEEGNGVRTLYITSEQYPEIKACRMVYDPVSYEITAAEMEFWKDALISKEAAEQKKFWIARIGYHYDRGPVPDLDRMLAPVVHLKNGRPQAGEGYKDYTLQSNY